MECKNQGRQPRKQMHVFDCKHAYQILGYMTCFKISMITFIPYAIIFFQSYIRTLKCKVGYLHRNFVFNYKTGLLPEKNNDNKVMYLKRKQAHIFVYLFDTLRLHNPKVNIYDEFYQANVDKINIYLSYQKRQCWCDQSCGREQPNWHLYAMCILFIHMDFDLISCFLN